MADRSALSDAVRKSVARSPWLGGAGLQCRRSPAESDQSILDAAAPGHRRPEGARSDRIQLSAVHRAFAAGVVPAVAAGADAYLSSTGDACSTPDSLTLNDIAPRHAGSAPLISVLRPYKMSRIPGRSEDPAFIYIRRDRYETEYFPVDRWCGRHSIWHWFRRNSSRSPGAIRYYG